MAVVYVPPVARGFCSAAYGAAPALRGQHVVTLLRREAVLLLQSVSGLRPTDIFRVRPLPRANTAFGVFRIARVVAAHPFPVLCAASLLTISYDLSNVLLVGRHWRLRMMQPAP